MSDALEFGIVANVVSDRALRTGAKVWLCLWTGGSLDKPQVRGLSKGGRTITKHIAVKRLTNFRAAWIPPTMREDVAMTFSKERAASLAADFNAFKSDRAGLFARAIERGLQRAVATVTSRELADFRRNAPNSRNEEPGPS